jgi:putative SOS response-associated peptidase YedK
MCNHYRVSRPDVVSEFARSHAETRDPKAWRAVNDAWPKSEMPIICQREKRTLTSARWGVWAFYEKERPTRLVTNARDDALFSKAIWRHAVQHGRCLVPADGFFEFTGPPGGKWEVLFELVDKSPFFFAGVWSQDPVGDEHGFALVTGRPNELVAELPHDRMPVILDPSQSFDWLGSDPVSEERALSLCTPYPAAKMIRTDMPRPTRTVAPKPGEQGDLFSL